MLLFTALTKRISVSGLSLRPRTCLEKALHHIQEKIQLAWYNVALSSSGLVKPGYGTSAVSDEMCIGSAPPVLHLRGSVCLAKCSACHRQGLVQASAGILIPLAQSLRIEEPIALQFA
jgi:hypothetical protein